MWSKIRRLPVLDFLLVLIKEEAVFRDISDSMLILSNN